MSSEDEFQQMAQQLEAIEAQIEALQSQIAGLREQTSEIDEAIDAIGTLDAGATVQVPIGGGAYVRASVEDMDEVIVGIGGGYATERTREEAISVLEDRKDQLDARIEELTETASELESQGQELGERAQQQLAQIQHQQVQGPGDLE